MTHASAGRGCLPRDECHNRFGHVFPCVGCCVLFGRAPDLAYHDDRVGLLILLKLPRGICVFGPDDRIAADADCGGLSKPERRQLSDCLIREVPDRETTPMRPSLW